MKILILFVDKARRKFQVTEYSINSTIFRNLVNDYEMIACKASRRICRSYNMIQNTENSIVAEDIRSFL